MQVAAISEVVRYLVREAGRYVTGTTHIVNARSEL
jgi:hypothetical protein